MSRIAVAVATLFACVWPARAGVCCAEGSAGPGSRVRLGAGWFLQSSVLVPEGGARVSTADYEPRGWFPTAVPGTVLSALVRNGVYPDPRIGLDCYRIPDSSDEFNRKNDLTRFSHLPEGRNPWRDPYWYRIEFTLPARGPAPAHRLWLNLGCVNYRADVWLNGVRVADRRAVAGMFQRVRLDVTAQAHPGPNALALLVHPVDHPGEPDSQLVVFGPHRGEHKEIERDVTMIETVGYDCMMTVPDRNMGLSQEIDLEWTGPVDLRHPFVATALPLPDKSRATLAVSAELVNTAPEPVRGTLRGRVAGTDTRFEQRIDLAPGEVREVRVAPAPVMRRPRLWWPVHHGEQALYDLALEFVVGDAVTAARTVTFGVRQVGSEMHRIDGWHGRRLLINGRRIFCRGGYIQPELLLDWDARRIDAEVRYFADANLNLVYFEDIPNPPDAFLDACDRRGVLFGNCFYACSWVTKPGRPEDLGLLERCTVDLVRRYRNHPSLVLYMSMDEGYTCADVYRMWRRHVAGLDGTRFWIPSGYLPDYIKGEPTAQAARFAHFRQDLPVGMNDLGNKSYKWQEPATYFRWVRQDGSWMFKMESGSASLPPISSLARFLPGLGGRVADAIGAPFPLTPAWAHHGANDYYQPYDEAIRRLHGEPESVADYCWKAHLVTADQHRSLYEAVNHRMWEVTSGFTEWKINSCFPDVQWQTFDYYHKPGVSHFFIRRACEPLHVQLDRIDHAVDVVNCRPTPRPGLGLEARVFDGDGRELWRRRARVDAPADAVTRAFEITGLGNLAPFLFVKLALSDPAGRVLSDNFYWLCGRGTPDYAALRRLEPVRLDATRAIAGGTGEERCVRVRVSNPSGRIAFFTQLALTRARDGAEILPVYWDDNYFSLLPGETRELEARIPSAGLEAEDPQLEIGGWNVETDCRCVALAPSKPRVKVGEQFTVNATVTNTFLDGSRVALRVNDRFQDARWAWARGGRTDEIAFRVALEKRGAHRLTVAGRDAVVIVE